MVPGTFIQQAVVSSSRGNMDLISADHVMEPVCIHPCRIHHIPGFKSALIRNQFISFFQLPDLLYFGLKAELYAVHIRILGQRNI